MKIKSIKKLNDGMEAYAADSFWSDVEKFAQYSFNKSHSVEYTLISWTTMWLKTYYPSEFYAAAMTVAGDDDKVSKVVMDAQASGVRVLPPDINVSTDRVEIDASGNLVAPFQAVKGISTSSATALVELRKAAGGKFSFDQATGAYQGFNPADQKVLFDKVRVNKTAIEKLRVVGATHSIDGEGVPQTHPDRLRDQLMLVPGYTTSIVKSDRVIPIEVLGPEILKMQGERSKCDKCSLSQQPHVMPRLGSAPKFMMVFDAPNWQEEEKGVMLNGSNLDIIKGALSDVGLNPNHGYYTSLVKARGPKGQKGFTTDQINKCSEHLVRELEVLKPPVIITMGANAARYFSPTMKGGSMDIAGKAIYDAKLDATVIFGFNPGQIFHDASKLSKLQEVFATLAETV